MTLKRQRLTCSCGVNACGEVPRRRLNTAHLRSTPPRQCFQGSCGVSAAGIVRRCTAVHLITSSLRKEVNEAVCWSERKTAGTQRKLLYWLMSRKLGSSLKDIGGKKIICTILPDLAITFLFLKQSLKINTAFRVSNRKQTRHSDGVHTLPVGL